MKSGGMTRVPRPVCSLPILGPIYSRIRAGLSTIKHPPYAEAVSRRVIRSGDAVRYAAVGMALSRLDQEGIEGAMAECGVWQGRLSSFLHSTAPVRRLYVFDTFSGFPEQNLEAKDRRFSDTSIELVKQNLGDLTNVELRPGYFPETTAGLEHERFAFVMLDMDLYKSTIDGLEFFHPRMVPGGYIFLHDFNNPLEPGVRKAVAEFFPDKPERIIELPDYGGCAVVRKC
jgi:O-methyltransferase